MSTRSRLEREISRLEKQIKEAPKDTPVALRKIWEDQLIDLSFELNNMVDGDQDNNLE